MADPVVETIGNQRRRLVATILGHAEREIYPSLTQEQQLAFRAKVLQSTSAFSDFVIDTVRASSQGGIWINEDVVELLATITAQARNSTSVP